MDRKRERDKEINRHWEDKEKDRQTIRQREKKGVKDKNRKCFKKEKI